MLMQILGSFAEFERSMIRERTRAGLDAARSQGRRGGRRPKLNADQTEEVRKMVLSGRKSAVDALLRLKKWPSDSYRVTGPPRPTRRGREWEISALR
jgi:DNA invertase Pin-like site-specific DNA recombinase